LFGRPRKRKTCSLAFSIRKNRQETIQIKRNKIEIGIPKFKQKVSGKPNFFPSTHNHQFLLVTLKKDSCGTCWFKMTLEDKIKPIQLEHNTKSEKVVVGIDMGLKTTRCAVSVNTNTKEIVESYQPIRVRYFEKSYQALVWASTKDKRHLPFVYRKIARRRLDNIGKDITKILSMGDEFKFGKPSAAFLFSGRLARSAADAANSMFLTRFAKRAELAQKKSGEVDEAYTSVTCRKCLNKKPMPLSLRVYECDTCAHVEDRDINSSYQIAFRDFPQENDEKVTKIKSKGKANGQLSGREMKFERGISRRDFQAPPPCKPPDSFGGGASAD
jgi:transposase